MTDLPPGWERATLSELSIDAQPGFASGKHNREGDGILHLRPMNITREGKIDTTDARYVDDVSDRRTQSGDVLFNNTNSPELVGKTGLVTLSEPVAYSNHMTRLRPPPEIDSAFLALQLQWLWLSGYFRKVLSHHVNQASVSLKVLLRTEIFVPPLSEQRRIVAALEGHFSRLNKASSELFSLVSRLSSFSAEIVRAAFAEGRPARGSASSRDMSNTGLPTVPAHWTWQALGDIAEVVGGVTKDAKRQGDTSFSEVPYLRVANVQRGWLDLSEISYIRVPAEKAAQLELRPGDVLLNEGGDRDKLGRGWIWEGQIPGCIHQNHVFRARLMEGTLHPKLLALFANHLASKWFELNGRQSVNLASISLSRIKRLPVPIPPIEEQDLLVERLDSQLSYLKGAQAIVDQSLTKAALLRESILVEAFAGRLVPQDPSDEPASELLARIRAERAAAAAPKRRPRRTGVRSRGAGQTQKETLL